MHLVLRPDISIAVAMISAMHAPLGTYLTFKDDPVTQAWEKISFVKILHQAINIQQFKLCRNIGLHRVFTESTLDNIEVCIGFKPLFNDGNKFDDIPLWKEPRYLKV